MGKKILGITLLVVLGFCASNTLAINGPATAGLNKGQLSAGLDYSYTIQDLKETKFTWHWNDSRSLPESGVDKIKVNNVETQRYYGRIGYGIDDWWEVYLQLGLANVSTDVKEETTDFFDGPFSLHSDTDIAFGWGTKITFAKPVEKINWGLALQMNWLNTSWSKKGANESETMSESWKDTVDIKTWDLLLAVGPTIDMGGWKLYGGPFFYYLNGDVNAKETGTGTLDKEPFSWEGKASGDLKTDSSVGGYIGAQFEVAKNWDTTVEFSSTGKGWGLGGGITVKF